MAIRRFIPRVWGQWIILFIHFWKWIILAALLATGIFLMYQRLRELNG